MRLNKYIASRSMHSRRAADQLIQEGRIKVNGEMAIPGQDVLETDIVALDGTPLAARAAAKTIMLNKPEGYVVSRNGQGSKTIYDLLPPELAPLNPVGRLDKHSSGLLLLTNDGDLTEQLTHPRYAKQKIYEVILDKPLQPLHRQMIADIGIQLADGPSRLILERLSDGDEHAWRVQMHEGRNRQIRRTFAALGYDVRKLHRTHFGQYTLGTLEPGAYTPVTK